MLYRGGGLHPGGVRPLPPDRPTAPSRPGELSLTMDGVRQAPGRPDEDRRGGFAHGGWAQPDNDVPGMSKSRPQLRHSHESHTDCAVRVVRFVAESVSARVQPDLPWRRFGRTLCMNRRER